MVESLRKEMLVVADGADKSADSDDAVIGAATGDAANWVPIAKANTPDSTPEPTIHPSIVLRVFLSSCCMLGTTFVIADVVDVEA